MDVKSRPNVVFVFADQWRQQATGYAGDPNVHTPHLDALAAESVNFTQAISGCSVCSPYRASLLTGCRPLTHGVFVNDVYLEPRTTSLARAFASAGYDTGYIGKWHLDGRGRSSYIPPERRQGFAYWKVLECTHEYNSSAYYADDSTRRRHWDGYDAVAQTRDAQRYIRDHAATGPFLLMLSWGPPHDPYDTAPAEFAALYDPAAIALRPNVPETCAAQARQDLAGYYAHCSALDACLGDLLTTLRECDMENDTVFVFTSDHGDMLGSHGHQKKHRPWDESLRVPFLLRYPGLPGWRPRETNAILDAPDIMPTLLGLCGIPVPECVEGADMSDHVRGGDCCEDAALITCAHPFGQWSARFHGGKEYRGLRTTQYTYVRDLNGPWLLYDNSRDPYQTCNLIEDAASVGIRAELEACLQARLAAAGDAFLPGSAYLQRWGYEVGQNGAVPFTP